jgi:membrane protein implicated in regulation of membrane protease activity
MYGAAIFWLILMVAFLFIEANTVSLVSVWFAGGALVALIAALLQAALEVQVILFIGVSGILLTLLRPILRKYVTPKLTKTNVDAVIGSKGIVLTEINNDLSQGQVKLGAMEWTARSTSGEKLVPGTQIVVDRIEGVKVFVSPVKQEEPVA